MYGMTLIVVIKEVIRDDPWYDLNDWINYGRSSL